MNWTPNKFSSTPLIISSQSDKMINYYIIVLILISGVKWDKSMTLTTTTKENMRKFIALEISKVQRRSIEEKGR